jgi:hypothetical protein
MSATGGSALMRRIPNAEHSVAGHTLSLFFCLRSLYLSLYDVSLFFNHVIKLHLYHDIISRDKNYLE